MTNEKIVLIPVTLEVVSGDLVNGGTDQSATNFRYRVRSVDGVELAANASPRWRRMPSITTRRWLASATSMPPAILYFGKPMRCSASWTTTANKPRTKCPTLRYQKTGT